MTQYFKRKARALSVPPEEELLMALGRTYLYPSANFVAEFGGSITPTKMLCHDTEDLWSLPKLECGLVPKFWDTSKKLPLICTAKQRQWDILL